MNIKISVVIPTKNEESYLPRLLRSLARQDVPVHEVIVADGGSTDRTQQIALDHGCRIVEGPRHPSVGRNRGGQAATGDLLLFIDADTRLPRGFLRRFLKKFQNQNLGCAVPWYLDYDGSWLHRLIFVFSTLMMTAAQLFQPFGAGYFIAVRRPLFEALGGFREDLYFCEDHDFVRRASRRGRFRVLPVVVRVSMRRFRTSGFRRTLNIYFKTSALSALGQRFTQEDPRYEFGCHD